MKVFFTVLTLLVSSSLAFASGTTTPKTFFKVSFQSSWSKATHPVDFPSNPHYSPITGAIHTADYSLYLAGDKVSEGVKNVAETGNRARLVRELRIAQRLGTVGSVVSAPGLSTSPGSVSFEIEPDVNYPLLSLVTMIAPSPDWIVGLRNISLVEGGSFVSKKVIPLYAYDAGTDSGNTYVSANAPTSGVLSLLNQGEIFVQNKSLVPFGTITIEKVER